MKVLHSVRPFLRISENWIYPQIMDVPDVQPGILCDARVNPEQFPAPDADFIFDPPPWHQGSGLPRLVNSLAFRLGARGFIAGAAVRRWRPAIIHAHFGMTGCDLLPLAKGLNVPLVTSFYGIDAWKVSPDRQRALDSLFADGAAFIAEGPAMAERLARIGCPSARIHVCRIGVDLTRLNFRPAAPEPKLRVAMMARFVAKKGFPDGLRACAQAVDQGIDLAVTIIGDATEGDSASEAIRDELHTLASQPALAGRVSFAGFRSPAEVQSLLYQHDIFLVPSLHAPDGDAEGGAPVALTEAMAMGLLCLGSRHCDIPETVQENVTGFLATSGDVSAFAGLLERAAASPDRFSDLRHAGRRHVERLFSRQQQVETLRHVYRTVAPPSGASDTLQFTEPAPATAG